MIRSPSASQSSSASKKRTAQKKGTKNRTSARRSSVLLHTQASSSAPASSKSTYQPARIIQRKRDGESLTIGEIQFFIDGLKSGAFTDYQATALLMAIVFQGMTPEETAALTRAMIESGERYDLSGIPGKKVDKHSTGGVGDKVSLILAPLVAACGVHVPMMTGRGLGHTGGTVDKLESIEGFEQKLSAEQFKKLVRENGTALICQTESIAPADRKLYALRDVTATIECVPLITASILSKKIAEGSEALVLDVKVGNGAFMKTKDEARKLARSIIRTAAAMGVHCRALLTSMDQPLGYAAGNALEVLESIEILRGTLDQHATEAEGGPWDGVPNPCSSADLKEITLQLASHMLVLAKVSPSLSAARQLAQSKLSDGSAWKKFQQIVKSQGGSLEQILNPETKLPIAHRKVIWTAKKKGFIAEMNTETIGRILVELGAGRKKASDPVDPAVGMVFHRKLGAAVKVGDPLVTVFLPERKDLDVASLESEFHQALVITSARKPVPKLVLDTLGE